MARKKQQREYICRGELTLNGVAFLIRATSLEEAQQKAGDGRWDDWNIDGAESTDWMLKSEVEENA